MFSLQSRFFLVSKVKIRSWIWYSSENQILLFIMMFLNCLSHLIVRTTMLVLRSWNFWTKRKENNFVYNHKRYLFYFIGFREKLLSLLTWISVFDNWLTCFFITCKRSCKYQDFFWDMLGSSAKSKVLLMKKRLWDRAFRKIFVRFTGRMISSYGKRDIE